MALLDDVSLKLLFEAENNAQSAIDDLVTGLGDLTDVLKALQDADPFAILMESADALKGSLDELTGSVNGLKDAFGGMEHVQAELTDTAAVAATTAEEIQTEMTTAAERVVAVFTETTQESAQAFSELELNAQTVAEQIAAQYTQVSDEMKTQMVAAAQEIASISVEAGDSIETALQGAAQAAKDVAMDLGLIPSVFTDLTSEAEQFNATLEQTAATAQDVATATKEALSGGGATTGGAGGSHGSLGSTVLMGGMNAMMGYYGLQMLANSGMQWSALEQMQKINNSTPQQAAQMMGILGMAGMTGSSATSFLSGLAGQLRTTFTPQVGTGMLSQQAILLQSLGITQQDVAQSPAMLLNTIAQRYTGLLHSGQGSAASQLLSLTGTSQMAQVFQNWSTVQSQTQNMLPSNVTSQQVQQMAKEGLSMTASMERLAWAFSELAATFIPLVTPLITAFSRLVSYFTGGGSELQRITRLLEGIGVTLASINIAKALFGKVVPSMLVRAGVVNVAGGGTASAAESVGGTAAAGEGEAVAAGAGAGAAETGAVAGAGLLATAITGLRSAFAAFGATIDPLIAVVGTTLAGAWAALGGVLTTVGEVVGGALLAAFEAISLPVEAVIAAIAALGVGIVLLVTHWRQVTQWVTAVGGDIGRWVATTSAQFTQWTARTGGDLSKWSGTTLHTFGSWVSKTGGDFLHWSGTTLKDLGAWITKSAGDFATWSGQTLKTLQQWATQALSHFVVWNINAARQIQQWAGTAISAFQNWAQNTGTVIQQWTTSVAQLVSQMVSTLSSMVSSAGQMIRNVGSSIGNWVSNTVKSVGQTIGQSLFGNGQTPTSQKVSLPGNVTSWIQSAMKDAGVGGGQWLTGLTAMVAHESGGNPNAVNPLGINPTTGQIMKAGGEHATGIAQMLMSTFQAYMKPGMNNILNPIDNLVSSIRYIQSRYGGIGGMEKASGLLTGNYKGYASGGLISETIAGLGLSSGQQYLFGEAGPEYILPMTGTEGASGTGGAPIINVTVQAMTNDPQQLGRIVAQEIVSQVKRRGNFSWRP